MRNAFACNLDGYDSQEWDTNKGQCVFDYIIHKYGNVKGFISSCNIKNLTEIFEDNTCLEMGVNTNHIEKFCKRFNIPMYALNENEMIFRVYNPEKRNKHGESLMFRISNNHFYAVPKNIKQSIIEN